MAELPPNPTLAGLSPFIGEWEVAVPQFGGEARGHAAFSWL
jgi:hypothetical protein